MKARSLILAFLFAATAWADPATPAAEKGPSLVFPPTIVVTPPAAARPNPASLQLKFVKVPLGNVTRVLSARFNVQVSISANARVPITGDFSRLDLRSALAEAARQAGLVVTALGADPAAGFSLALPEAKAPPAVAVDTTKAAFEAAARQREELLKQRASLQEQSPHPNPQG
jgi:hypothetical protein